MNQNTRFQPEERTKEEARSDALTTSDYSLLLTNEETGNQSARPLMVSQRLRQACSSALGRCTETERRQLRALMYEGCTEDQLLYALTETTFAPRPTMRYAATIARRMRAQGVTSGAEDRRRWLAAVGADECQPEAGSRQPKPRPRQVTAQMYEQRPYTADSGPADWLRDKIAEVQRHEADND